MEVYQSSRTAAELEYALGAVPSIGENGNWFIGEQDTGVLAEGLTPYVGSNGNWFIGEQDTGVLAVAQTPYVGENGNWWINNEDTGVPAAGSNPDAANAYMTQSVGVSDDKKLFTLPFGGGEFRVICTVDTGDASVSEVVISADADGNPFELEEVYILVDSATKRYSYAGIQVNGRGVGEDRGGKPACISIRKFQGMWMAFVGTSGYASSNPFGIWPYHFSGWRNKQLLADAGHKIKKINLEYTQCKLTVYGRD